MIKGKWQGIVFVALVLLLAIGLSTVALNEQSEEEVEKVDKMSIALVNEDGGTEFNESGVNFGDEFSNRMNKSQSHDWYIVSRGVAESGFERNVYDMLIVIPNDFSEKALSIDENSPEQVALEYKINATGHEDVRAEAEKTAGEILTNFNKELIDVFFVSIIGNLQEAQDHIVDIINKEKEYTDEYTANIFHPLDNFTNQFDQVKQYTDMSKNNYNQLDDVLNNFESSLSDKAETSAEYDGELEEALQQGESYSEARSSFADLFDQFYEQLTREESIDQLSQVNGDLYERFRQKNEADETNNQDPLQDRLEQLNNHFDTLKSNVKSYEETINKELSKEIKEKIEDGVAESFEGDKMRAIKLVDLISDLDENILENMNQSIALLPGNTIDDLALPDSTKRTLQNVATVSEAFEKEEEFSTAAEEGHSRTAYSLLEKPFKQFEEELEKGITVTDTITIKEYTDNKFDLSLDAPEGFIAKDVKVNGQIPDEDTVTLEAKESDDALTVDLEATLVLAEEQDINKTDDFFFQPVDWNWSLKQEKTEETEVEKPSEEPDNDSPSNDDQENEESPSEEKEEEPSTDDGKDEKKDSQPEEESSIQEEDQIEESSESEGSENITKDDDQEVKDTEKQKENLNKQPLEDPTVIEKTINNYHYQWNQSVETSLLDTKEFTGDFIENAVGLYEAIDSLNTMYDLYFGLDLTMEPAKLEEDIKNQGLIALAEEDSLYYLVHKKEVKESIKNRISDDVENSILGQMEEPLQEFKKNVESYNAELENIQGNSSNLTEALQKASTEAQRLNTSVGEVLDDVENWKNTSDNLVADQVDLQSQDSEVQTALLSLGNGFKPILSTSQSLAEQAQSNFDSTEQVYETLDSIDEEADTIQQSGITLISNANNLASKFSEKAAEDMDFAENFNEVLDNSRIGDRQNEDLYSFLSNPVESKNTGIIKETQSFIPYFVVFIMAVISFFTAYVLSNHRGPKGQVGEFETDQTFVQRNVRPMLMTGGIGLIEGVVIGITSFVLLDIPQSGAFSWVALITTMMLGMVLIATYALRQLQMVGMFLLLVVFSMYLLLTKSLGFQFGGNEAVSVARKISPLQQLENWVHGFIEGTMSTGTLTIAFIILIIAVIVGLALNMLIIDNSAKEAGVDDERTKEAN